MTVVVNFVLPLSFPVAPLRRPPDRIQIQMHFVVFRIARWCIRDLFGVDFLLVENRG